jgi:hypothetical protein
MTDTQKWAWTTPQSAAEGSYTITHDLQVLRRIPAANAVARTGYVPPAPKVQQYVGQNRYTGWGGLMNALGSGQAAHWSLY